LARRTGGGAGSCRAREPRLQVEFEAKSYQVEIEVLENTDRAIRVMVAVDDGSLPASILPATDDFHCEQAG